MRELSDGTKIFLVVMIVLIMIWAYMQHWREKECMLPGYSKECSKWF